MKTVRLFGQLGKRFTESVELDVKSAAEAIRALCVNFKGFEAFMMNSEQMGLRYKVVVAGDAIASVDEINHPASGFIDIIPIVRGAGGPVERIFAGAVLIAAAVFLGPAGSAFLSAGVAQVVGSIGVSLAINGVSQLLSPAPSPGKPNERPENTPSNYFNGPVNTTLQGQAVPLAYGQVIVGSAIVSAGISVDQIQPGFKVVLVEATAEVTALTTPDNYLTQPPAGWFRRELLQIRENVFIFNTTAYDYRFYFYQETLVPL